MTAQSGFILFYFLFSLEFTVAQSPGLNTDKWLKELSNPNDKQNESFAKLDSLLDSTDSTNTFLFLNELLEKGQSKNGYFRARFNCLKSRQLYQKNFSRNLAAVKEEVKLLFASAINKAYESDDEHLIVFVSINYGGLIYLFGETELSVMYLMNGVELNEKLSGGNKPAIYQSLGELLYRIKEYKSSLEYSHRVIDAWKNNSSVVADAVIMSCMNTTALCYHRLGVYDSAFIYYHMALQMANKLKNDVWKGIISGNMGQIYYLQNKYDSALVLLELDYRTSNAAGFFDNAANSLQWMARTELAKGNKSTALNNVREAIQLLTKWPDMNYLRNSYFTAMQVFKELSIYDSAFIYSNLYSRLNDSLERVVSLSSIAISKARLNDEQSRYSIKNLQREKKSQLLQRNILIGAIVVLSFIALVLVNRQRLKSRLQMEFMQKESLLAKEQMKMFTENIVEKTSWIEKLEQQAKNREASVDQQMMITELSHQTILTEEDWIKFKTLFEKIYPGFFKNVKERSNDITVAEQRMAALIRLQLTNKQVASMLGISVESVHKTRQRLRHRLQIATENSLEEFIAQI